MLAVYSSKYILLVLVMLNENVCARVPDQNALQILEEFADMKDDDLNYSRALAFRRASATLRSYPHPVVSIEDIKGLPDIGSHCQKVIEVWNVIDNFVVVVISRHHQIHGNRQLEPCSSRTKVG